jgi:hypothetical protein
MSDLEPFIDEDPNGIEADLFRTARDERPSDGARQRVAAALGIPDPGLPGDGSGTPTGGATPPSVSVGSTLGASSGAGKLAAALVVAGLAAGLAWQLRSKDDSSAAAPASSASLGVSSHEAQATPAPSEERSAASSDRDVLRSAAPVVSPSASAPVVASGQGTSSSAAPSASASRLTEEIASIDRARQLLRGGDAPGALREIARHRKEFPRGSLGVEATLLEIEALAGAGQRGTALSRARAMLAQSPDSPYAARLREILPEL